MCIPRDVSIVSDGEGAAPAATMFDERQDTQETLGW